MARRANAYFNFGYFDAEKSGPDKEDHTANSQWNDMPMTHINHMQRILHKAHGELIELGEMAEAAKGGGPKK